MLDDFIDWLTFSNWGCLAGLIGIILIVSVPFGCVINADNQARKKFMAECLQDHKQYECTVMWRQGENNTAVVPIPVVIPIR